MAWLNQLHDPEGLKHLIVSGGVVLLMIIVFSETGLLVGFFLPGDSLLFLAGALCSVNLLNPTAPPPLDFMLTTVALTIAAILGNTVNYWLGRWAGVTVWDRPDGRFIKRRYLEDAHAFYEKWGAVSLVLTRYVPIARTFVPFVAGVSRMRFAVYTLWNVVGAMLWVPVLMAIGYWLGQIPFVQRNLETIVLGVIIISVLPMLIGGGFRWRRMRREALNAKAANAANAAKAANATKAADAAKKIDAGHVDGQ